MNAISKATEHKRKPPRPRVSEAGRRVLEWLDKYGPQYSSVQEYRELWSARKPGSPDEIAELLVTATTIRALWTRGLVYLTAAARISPQDCRLVGITDLGREVSRGAK